MWLASGPRGEARGPEQTTKWSPEELRRPPARWRTEEHGGGVIPCTGKRKEGTGMELSSPGVRGGSRGGKGRPGRRGIDGGNRRTAAASATELTTCGRRLLALQGGEGRAGEGEAREQLGVTREAACRRRRARPGELGFQRLRFQRERERARGMGVREGGGRSTAPGVLIRAGGGRDVARWCHLLLSPSG